MQVCSTPTQHSSPKGCFIESGVRPEVCMFCLAFALCDHAVYNVPTFTWQTCNTAASFSCLYSGNTRYTIWTEVLGHIFEFRGFLPQLCKNTSMKELVVLKSTLNSAVIGCHYYNYYCKVEWQVSQKAPHKVTERGVTSC